MFRESKQGGFVPVDGFSVERAGEKVVLTLSNRYGEADVFVLPVTDARRIADVLQRMCDRDHHR